MARYEVVIPWHGKAKGDIIETDKLHSALNAHVRLIAEKEVAKKEANDPEEKPARRGRPPKDKE